MVGGGLASGLGVFSVAGLAACGGGSAVSPAAAPINSPVTIEFYHEWDGVRTKLVEDMIVDFKSVQPSITVKHTLTRGTVPSENIFTTVVAGNPPDVAMALTHVTQVWARQKGVRFVDDLLKRDKINADQTYYKATSDLVKLDNKYTGLPVLVAGVDPVFMYNTRLFSQIGLDPAKPPKTWQEAEDQSNRATQKDGSRLTRIGMVPTERGVWEWMYLNNAQVFAPDKNGNLKVMFDGPEGQEALQWVFDFTRRVYGGIDAVAEFYKQNRGTGASGPRVPWYSGTEVMWLNLVSTFFRVDEEQKGFPLGAVQAPYNAKNAKAKVGLVAERTWMYVIPSGAKQENAAWAWQKYSTMEDGAKKFINVQQRPSPVRKFNEDKSYRDLNPHWDVVLKNLESSVPLPQTPAWDEVRTILTRTTEAVLAGKQGVKDALGQAAQQSQVALDRYRQ